MTHGSLFSGIGGFDLAAEWMGWKNLFHCEWNPFGQKVLKYYWPDAELFTDITKSNFTKYANKIDILTGGFPCQPYSQAGKRLGKDDERHLWPEMLRVIQEVKPTYIVGENVRGLTNWNGGVVFEEVCVDLENCGYEVQPVLLPACAVNAPHRRDRVWFVAYSNITSTKHQIQTGRDLFTSKIDSRFVTNSNNRRLERSEKIRWNGIDVIGKSQFRTPPNSNSNGFNECDSEHEVNAGEGRFNAFHDISENDGQGDASDTSYKGLQRKQNKGEDKRTEIDGLDNRRGNTSGVFRSNWQEFPTQSPICNGDDGLSNRLDSITFPKWRNESIKAGGNAIVPQVAYQIFKTIEQMELLIK